MNIKNLQYVMSHSDVGVTPNVYTHASFDRAAEQMAKSLRSAPRRLEKSGLIRSWYYTNYYTICP